MSQLLFVVRADVSFVGHHCSSRVNLVTTIGALHTAMRRSLGALNFTGIETNRMCAFVFDAFLTIGGKRKCHHDSLEPIVARVAVCDLDDEF